MLRRANGVCRRATRSSDDGVSDSRIHAAPLGERPSRGDALDMPGDGWARSSRRCQPKLVRRRLNSMCALLIALVFTASLAGNASEAHALGNVTARDWTGDTESLSLSSTGLSIDAPGSSPSTTQAGEGAEKADGSSSTQGGLLGAVADALSSFFGGATTDSAEATLPDEIPAHLNLTFSLDPSQAGKGQDSGAAKVSVGDTFSVTLPEGIRGNDVTGSLPDGEKFDVFQLGEDGKPTNLKIAEGKLEDRTLEVTLVQPTEVEMAAATSPFTTFINSLTGAITTAQTGTSDASDAVTLSGTENKMGGVARPPLLRR